jgi:Ni/Co efflux regulator RcnB
MTRLVSMLVAVTFAGVSLGAAAADEARKPAEPRKIEAREGAAKKVTAPEVKTEAKAEVKADAKATRPAH